MKRRFAPFWCSQAQGLGWAAGQKGHVRGAVRHLSSFCGAKHSGVGYSAPALVLQIRP
ncbi:Calcium-transporting ATPase 1 [Acetobacter orientalis]|uniref:Calcium-transporting ATPase 1 n=1 Tax=Acetobacter orientalis TaxID=146474 RepID=A0A2Z5ZKL4_9PROT|nr:Calcium-transporting ATPase 1 [Acetobacter orientalis]